MAKGPGGGGGGGGGQPKDPTIYGTIGNDIISLAGNPDHGDMVDGLAGNDTITGSRFQDFLYGNDGADRIFGGAGDDWIEGGTGNDYMDGGTGFFDWVTFDRATNGVTVDLAVTTAQNTGVGVDTILNFENLSGTGSNDTLRGNAGNNQLFGGDGNDVIEGRDGDDIIQDSTGDDRFLGGAGNDYISDGFSGGGRDTIDGGLGSDTLDYNATYASAAVTIDLNLTTAQNTGFGGVDTIIGIENVMGTRFADIITGNAADNVIDGAITRLGYGADVIKGMGGNDTITSYGTADGGTGNDKVTGLISAFGGDGDDIVTSTGFAGGGIANGGAGNDTVYGTGSMTGGTGADRFWFGDVITDFSRAQLDKIDLSGWGQAYGQSAITFVGNAAFTSFLGHPEARVIAGATFQTVELDLNGDRIADMSMTVMGATALIASDFIL